MLYLILRSGSDESNDKSRSEHKREKTNNDDEPRHERREKVSF